MFSKELLFFKQTSSLLLLFLALSCGFSGQLPSFSSIFMARPRFSTPFRPAFPPRRPVSAFFDAAEPETPELPPAAARRAAEVAAKFLVRLGAPSEDRGGFRVVFYFIFLGVMCCWGVFCGEDFEIFLVFFNDSMWWSFIGISMVFLLFWCFFELFHGGFSAEDLAKWATNTSDDLPVPAARRKTSMLRRFEATGFGDEGAMMRHGWLDGWAC